MFHVEKINNDNVDKRCVRKEFKCQSCYRIFKKLVQILIEQIICPFCNSKNCKPLKNPSKNSNINIKSKTQDIDNLSIKSNITTKEDEVDNKNNVINQDGTLNKEENKKFFLCKKKLLENIKPFSKSPFANSVHRHNFDIEDILDDGILTTVTKEFFIDNFASNFISNFDNPLGRIVFIQMQIDNNSKIKSQPLLLREIKQVQQFEMSVKYCKQSSNNTNEFELPNCIYCLKDILLETNCFLLRCGHLIHDKCFYQWVKEHRICPVCKFNIMKKGSARKSSLDLMIDDAIKEKIQINKTFPDEDMNQESGKEQFNIIDMIDHENNNINIIGEKKFELDFFLE